MKYPDTSLPTKAERVAFFASIAFRLGGASADVISTLDGIDRGAYEGNPILALFGTRSMRGIVGMALATQLVANALTWRLFQRQESKKGRGQVIAVNMLAGTMHVGAALYNRHVCK